MNYTIFIIEFLCGIILVFALGYFIGYLLKLPKTLK